MYIRRDRKKSGVTYLLLAHNVREQLKDGMTRSKPIVFANLGREDLLDEEVVVGMRNAFDRYIAKRFGTKPSPARVTAAAADARPMASSLRVLGSRTYGMGVVVNDVWEKLGLKAILHDIEDSHDITFPFERLVFAMVLNRLLDPKSKRACNAWIKDKAYFPELAEVQVQHFYRALDLLEKHTEEIVDALVTAAVSELPPDERISVSLDTTSTYTESEMDDAERQQLMDEWLAYDAGDAPEPTSPRPRQVNNPPTRMRGHSKDKRPDKPQVKLGLTATQSGLPVGVLVEAGSVHDQRLTVPTVTALQRRVGDREVVAVMDSGMGGMPNLKALDALETAPHRVSAVPLRQSSLAENVLLAKPGRWKKHPYRPGFQMREALIDGPDAPLGRPERLIATRNLKEARRQERALDKHIATLRAHLAKDARVDGHGLPMCKTLARPKFRRLLKTSKDGKRYVLDKDRERIERRRAGVHVLRSTLVDVPPAVTLRYYDAHYGIEAQFRTLKTPLRMRPMHHRSAPRIRGHLLMCGMALMIWRVLEAKTGRTFGELRSLLESMQVLDMQQGDTRFWQREEWSPEAASVLELLEIEEGPRTWGGRRA